MTKRWTKMIGIITMMIMLFSVAACGNNAATPPKEEPKAEQTQAPAADAKTIKLSTTTSVRDSGLLDAILPAFEDANNIKVDVIAQGSGAALETGRRGDADVLLVHSPAAEKTFMDEGFGLNRQTFMHNYYVIVGPAEDPAGIKGLSAAEAFQAIADNDGVFASRGDESGTHSKELSIWKSIDVDPTTLEQGEKYLSLGKGMGDTLTLASEQGTYTLTDLSTFLSMKDKLNLEVLVDESDDLKNEYSVIQVNPEKNENVDAESAQLFADWLVSDETLKMIADYGNEEYGQPLFFVNES